MSETHTERVIWETKDDDAEVSQTAALLEVTPLVGQVRNPWLSLRIMFSAYGTDVTTETGWIRPDDVRALHEALGVWLEGQR